jgi:Flp pilus assembly pilin Flp
VAEIRDSWREVASKAEALGLKLRLHLESEEHDAPTSAEGDTEPGPSEPTGTTTGTTRAAIDDLGNKLKDAFESFGAAAKDPAVRSDVTDIGLLLKDALVATFTAVGSDVGGAVKDVTGAVKKASSRAGGQPPANPPAADDPVSPSDATDGQGDD